MADPLAIALWLTTSLNISICTLGNPQLQTLQDYGVKLEFYDVAGLSEEEILQAILNSGPRDGAGEPRDAFFSWDFLINNKTQRQTNSVIRELADRGILFNYLETKLVLPCFKDFYDAPLKVREAWLNYHTRVVAHETRHAIHFFKTLPKLKHAIISEDEELFWSEITNLKRKDREYDYQTRHGASEGARLGRSCY